MDAFSPIPGIHAGTPYAVYHRWAALGNSWLGRLAQSPAHLKAYLEQGSRTTPAMELGRAIHVAVLEPDTFDSRYLVAERCTGITQKKEQCSKMGSRLTDEGWRCGMHPSNTITLDATTEVISPDDRATCYGIRDSIYRHPAAKALLAGITPQTAEVSICWTDPATGLLCKARPDYVTTAIAGGALVDLKSTVNAEKVAFGRSMFDHGYHRGAAWYLDGARECAIDVNHFVHLAVEKEYPFAVGVYRLRDEHVQYGRIEAERLKHRYAECLENDRWPAYSDAVEDIELPAYAIAQMEARITAEVAR